MISEDRRMSTTKRITDPSPAERASGFPISETPYELTRGMEGPIVAVDIVPTGDPNLILRDVTIRLTGEQCYVLRRVLDSFSWAEAQDIGLGNWADLSDALEPHAVDPGVYLDTFAPSI
jgi:hypothetical protein